MSIDNVRLPKSRFVIPKVSKTFFKGYKRDLSVWQHALIYQKIAIIVIRF